MVIILTNFTEMTGSFQNGICDSFQNLIQFLEKILRLFLNEICNKKESVNT